MKIKIYNNMMKKKIIYIFIIIFINMNLSMEIIYITINN